MKFLFTSIIALFFCALSVPAISQDDGENAVEESSIFDGYDLDGDGIIDRIEFGMSETAQRARDNDREELIAKIFNDLDKDKDNAVSRTEFDQEVEGTEPEEDPAAMKEEIQQQFQALDMNGDGVVDRREFGRSAYAMSALKNDNFEIINTVFGEGDANSDSQLTQGEFTITHEAMANSPQAPDDGPGEEEDTEKDLVRVFKNLDRDRDRKISITEFAHSNTGRRMIQRGGRDMVQLMFGRIDIDGDKFISLTEFTESPLIPAQDKGRDRAPMKGKGKGKGKGKAR